MGPYNLLLCAGIAPLQPALFERAHNNRICANELHARRRIHVDRQRDQTSWERIVVACTHVQTAGVIPKKMDALKRTHLDWEDIPGRVMPEVARRRDLDRARKR